MDNFRFGASSGLNEGDLLQATGNNACLSRYIVPKHK